MHRKYDITTVMLNIHPQFYMLMTEALYLNSCKNQETCCLRETHSLAQNENIEPTVITKHHNHIIMFSKLELFSSH